MASGYKIVDHRTGTSYPIPDCDTYEEALFVVRDRKLGDRVAIVPASWQTPFFLGRKVYPCPAKDEPVPILTYHGSGPKRVMTQEHPCLFLAAQKPKNPEEARYAPEILTVGYHPPSKMCHHPLCAREAHRKGYKCSCPAGDEPLPKMYYAPGGPVTRVMVYAHPCQSYPGETCNHVRCAWIAHSNDDYHCRQSTLASLQARTDLWRIESLVRKDAFTRWQRRRGGAKTKT